MIRRATTEDVEAIVRVFEPSFATLDFLPELHTHEENLAFFGRCVAEGEAYVLGDGFSILAGDTLTHLYVHPDAIGTGIGHALFEHACERRPGGFEFWVVPAERAGAPLLRAARVPLRGAHRRLRERGADTGRSVSVASCSPRIERAMTSRWISLVPS